MSQNLRSIVDFVAQATACGIAPMHAERLLALAKTARKLSENACNFGLSKAQQTRADNVDKEAREIVESYGLAFIAQGDPRGWPFIINEDEAGRVVNPNLPHFRVPPF